ncbi:MAG: DUF6515 family protein [Ferruginibacter sp.]
MEMTITSRIKKGYKIAGITIVILTCLYSLDSVAQGDRRREYNSQQSQERPRIKRESSIHQQSPAINRYPSPPRNQGNAGIINDRASRRNNNGFNRSGNGYDRPNGFTRPNNINRQGNNDVTSNRPGYSYNRGNSNDFNRRSYNYNNGNRGNYGRYNNNHRRPNYIHGNPNWRFACAPRRNSIFNTLPSSYFSINFGGFGYRYYDGIFYRPYNNVFRVVVPPIGIFVNVLPLGYSRIYVNEYPYYYYNGTYYDQRQNNYTVVSPPVGAVVESLPDGYETVTIDGETYYSVDGAQYKPVSQENGEIWYEVIKAN